MPFPFVAEGHVHVVHDGNRGLRNHFENAGIVEDERLFPASILAFFDAPVKAEIIIVASIGDKLVVVPHGHTETVAHVVTGGALVRKLVVRVFGVVGVFDRHDVHVLRIFARSRSRSVCGACRGFLGEVRESRLDCAFDCHVEIVDGGSLLLAAGDYGTVAHLFADDDNGATHGHEVRAELDIGTFGEGVARLGDRCTDNGLHHLGSIGREFGTGGCEDLDVGGKRNCREREKGCNNLLHAFKYR